MKIPLKDDTNIVELTSRRIEILLNFANLKQDDVFYDIGSGRGEIVRTAFRKYKVKKSIGIELLKSLYRISIKKTLNSFSNNPIGEGIEFWYGDFSSCDNEKYYIYNITNATVIFNSLDPTKEEENFYKTQFPTKKIRIIKKDMPLIGYLPKSINKEDRLMWFYLMETPLLKKTKSKTKWFKSILNNPNSTEEDFFKHLKKQWKKRGIYESDIKEGIEDLKEMINLELTKD